MNPRSQVPAWTAADRTGGPVDEVFDQLREVIPSLVVERLQVTHPADDDNLWFIGDEYGRDRIQIETSPGGQPSFLIENGGRLETSDPVEAASVIANWLLKTPLPSSDT